MERGAEPTLMNVVEVLTELLCGCIDSRVYDVIRDLLAHCETDKHREWSPLEQVALHALDNAALLDHGTSIRFAWREPLGDAVLMELTAPTLCVDCGHPAVAHGVCGYREKGSEETVWRIGDCTSPCKCRVFVEPENKGN